MSTKVMYAFSASTRKSNQSFWQRFIPNPILTVILFVGAFFSLDTIGCELYA